MDPVVHFEMPYDDANRLAKFYQAVFGWKMKNLGEQMGQYMLAGTSQNGADGMPKKPGRINGGFFPRNADAPNEPSVVVAVEDIGKAMAAVRGSGGSVLGEPMEIPGIGSYVSIRDTEGNRVGVLQPMAMPKARPAAKKKATGKKTTASGKKKSATKKKPAAKKSKKKARKSG
jgi:predicted enzyme related to lactoylglutathione lyase